MLLVKFDRNWADEFNVYGMAIMTQESFDSLMKWAKNASYYFGTNEGWEGEDISDGFTASEIDEDDIRYLRDLIFEGHDSFGIFPDWQEMAYDAEYDKYEIIQDGGGWVVQLEGKTMAFGFGNFGEANEWLHSHIEELLN